MFTKSKTLNVLYNSQKQYSLCNKHTFDAFKYFSIYVSLTKHNTNSANKDSTVGTVPLPPLLWKSYFPFFEVPNILKRMAETIGAHV